MSDHATKTALSALNTELNVNATDYQLRDHADSLREVDKLIRDGGPDALRQALKHVNGTMLPPDPAGKLKDFVQRERRYERLVFRNLVDENRALELSIVWEIGILYSNPIMSRYGQQVAEAMDRYVKQSQLWCDRQVEEELLQACPDELRMFVESVLIRFFYLGFLTHAAINRQEIQKSTP